MREADITSRQNPRVKAVCALADKKGREASGRFRIDGIKLFSEACRSDMEIAEVYVRLSSIEAVTARVGQELARFEHRMITVSDEVFAKMSEEKAPEGILAVAEQPKQLHRVGDGAVALLPHERVCFLEAIRDPGNLGTVIRTAAALGIHRLILSEDCADLYHPRTVRAAMGALFRQRTDRVRGRSLDTAIIHARESGRRVLATALHEDARILGTEPLRATDCFVIGNEGHGLCEQTLRACSDCVLIPMEEGSESLNASVAAAICLWELSRAN